MDSGLSGKFPTYKSMRGCRKSSKAYKAGLEKIKLEILEKQKLEEDENRNN